MTPTCPAPDQRSVLGDYLQHWDLPGELNCTDYVDPDGGYWEVAEFDSGGEECGTVYIKRRVSDDKLIAECSKRGCKDHTLAALRKAHKPSWQDDRPNVRTQTAGSDASEVEKLVKLGHEAELFCDQARRTGYASVKPNGHTETFRIGGSGFADWLEGEFYRVHGEKTPREQSLKDAVRHLSGRARRSGEPHEVFVRVGGSTEVVHIALHDDAGGIVKISADGWEILDESPYRFERCPGMLPLPRPVTGGSLDDLKKYLNITDDEWLLMLASITRMLLPRGPYVIVILGGLHGSTKSTGMRVIRLLVDPNEADTCPLPSSERDLFIDARNSWLQGYDNLSHVSNDMSDTLCRLSTGAGFKTRKLYKDDEQVIIRACRPIVYNGIGSVGARPDFRDRAVDFTLPSVDGRRRTEEEFWEEFYTTYAALFGAVLDLVAGAIRQLPSVQIPQERLPRMADYARWGVAVANALGLAGEEFLAAYEANRMKSTEVSRDSSPVAAALVEYMESISTQNVVRVQLQALYSSLTGDHAPTGAAWPRSAQGLRNQLDRLAPVLKAVGYDIDWGERTNRGRTVIISRVALSPAVRALVEAW